MGLGLLGIESFFEGLPEELRWDFGFWNFSPFGAARFTGFLVYGFGVFQSFSGKGFQVLEF